MTLDLVLGQLEAGEAGDVQDLVAAQRAWPASLGGRRARPCGAAGAGRVGGPRALVAQRVLPARAHRQTAADGDASTDRKPSQAPTLTSKNSFGPGWLRIR